MSAEGLAKNHGEQNRIRNEYKENLRKMAEINEKNYSINNEFYKSGILPASIQLKDTRSATDKLNDILFLKQKIASDMVELGSADFISKVIDGLSKSSLNLENKLIQYTAQNASEISKSIKRRYEIGIRGDTDDVTLLVKFIENMYAEIKATFKSVGDYVKSSVSVSKSGALDGETIKRNISDLLRKITLAARRMSDNEGFIDLPLEDNGLMKADEDLLIPERSVKYMNLLIRRLSLIYNAIPDNSTLQRLLKRIPETGSNLRYADIISTNPDFVLNSEVLQKALEVFYKLPAYATVDNLLSRFGRSIEQRNYNNSLSIIKEVWNLYQFDRKTLEYLDFLIEVVKPDLDEINVIGEDIEAADTYLEQKEIANRENIPTVRVINQDGTALRVVGEGIKKRRGRPLGSGMPKPVIIKEPRFIGFGINEINNEKLKNNILSIRRKTKTNIMGIPQRMVSDKFKSVIKTILGGGMPKFKELEDLDEEEKDYLYKIVNKSDLDEKLTVPAPSKDKYEKMVNEFEIMKGQIMSGNDNREYVKKFKLLVLKLVRSGYIPKNEGFDLVEELTSLGY